MSWRLLVIDPDPATRLLTRKALVPSGFDVADADDVASGLRLAERSAADLVLVDLDAGEMTPLELALTLRRSQGLDRAVLVAATADDDPGRLAAARAGGFQSVLVKPLDVDALARELLARVPAGGAPPAIQAPPAAEPAGIPARWRRTLPPLTEKLVRAASVVDGRLALLDGEEGTLILVAACSLRPAGAPPPLGLRFAVDSVPWLHAVLDTGQPALVDLEKSSPSPLLPPHSTAVLAVPIAAEGVTYGVVVLGERRRRASAFPPPQVDETVREAARIAAVLREFDRLDAAIREKRRAVERFRAAATQLVSTAGGAVDAARIAERDAVRLLSVRLGERLGMSVDDLELLQQAAELCDIGATWIRHALLPLMDLAAPEQQALLQSQREQTLEMLAALGWPPQVVDVVGAYLASRSGGPEPAEAPLAARVLAAAAEYRSLLSAPGPEPERARMARALAQLERARDRGLDRSVAGALAELVEEELANDRAPGQSGAR